MTDLSGGWTGSYAYPGCLDSVPFSAELRDESGRLSGLISECDLALGSALPQTATVSGFHDGATIVFTKIYDSHDELLEAINYRGDVDEIGCEISGTWTIEGVWSGPFVMIRPRASDIKVEVEASETV